MLLFTAQWSWSWCLSWANIIFDSPGLEWSLVWPEWPDLNNEISYPKIPLLGELSHLRRSPLGTWAVTGFWKQIVNYLTLNPNIRFVSLLQWTKTFCNIWWWECSFCTFCPRWRLTKRYSYWTNIIYQSCWTVPVRLFFVTKKSGTTQFHNIYINMTTHVYIKGIICPYIVFLEQKPTSSYLCFIMLGFPTNAPSEIQCHPPPVSTPR